MIIDKITERTALIISGASNLFLSFLFLRALINPEENVGFIVSTAGAIFVLEMLIQAFGAVLQIKGEKKSSTHTSPDHKQFPPLVLLVFIGIVYLIISNPIFLVYAIVMISSKLINLKNLDGATKVQNLIQPTIFFFYLFIFHAIEFTLSKWVGSEYLKTLVIEDQFKALMFEYPEGLLIWGITYYLLLTILDIYFHLKPPKDTEGRYTYEPIKDSLNEDV